MSSRLFIRSIRTLPLLLWVALVLGIFPLADGYRLIGRLFSSEPQENDRASIALELLRSNCFECHSATDPKADLRLDSLKADFLHDPVAAENWQLALDAIRSKEMPPPDKKQLSSSDRDTLAKWIEDELRRYIKASDVDRRPLRKLTRNEYQNTMRDLLGIDMDFAIDLPADPISPDGFTNDSRLLELTPIHWEAYLESARKALKRVIVSHDRPQEFHHTFERSNVSAWHGEVHITNDLGRRQQFLAKMESAYPEQGEFLVRVGVAAEQKPNRGFPLLEVSVGYRPDTEILFREFPVVEVDSPGQHTYEFRGHIEDFPLPVRGQGKFPGLVVRVRNVYDDGSPLPEGTKGKDKKFSYPAEPHLPLLHVQSVEFHGPIFDTWPPAQHSEIVTATEKGLDPKRSDVRRSLEKFVQRAFRRPASKTELRSLMKFYDKAKGEFPKFEDAFRETLAFVLIQPDFLFIQSKERQHASEDSKTPVEWVLASRLSYFLWSSMPDPRLFDLAKTGLLHQPEILKAEVERMLRSPKSSAFFEQFADQWLALNSINNVEINREYYPNFDASLKADMIAESRAFFAEMIRSNRSVQDFLLADFSMLNEPLARHYGVDGVFGIQFRRIQFPAVQQRGGLLGQAGVLLAGSTGADSHPVRRAVWIRDRLLNDPPAPPPANVPGLDSIDPKFHQLSMREKLEAHRHEPSCASCHRDLDPWGIALENFDAVGLWRDKIQTKQGDKFVASPVVAKDVFSDGSELSGPEQLKERLACEYGDKFARSMLTRMLTYALGRRLDVVDRASVRELEERFTSQRYRMRDLLQLIVSSELFQGRSFGSEQHDK